MQKTALRFAVVRREVFWLDVLIFAFVACLGFWLDINLYYKNPLYFSSETSKNSVFSRKFVIYLLT